MYHSILTFACTVILSSCATAQSAPVAEPLGGGAAAPSIRFKVNAPSPTLQFSAARAAQDPAAPPARTDMPALQGLGYIGQYGGGSFARLAQSQRSSIIAHKLEFQMGDEKFECTVGPGDAIVVEINGAPAGKDRYNRTEEGFEIIGKNGKPAAKVQSLMRESNGKLVPKKTKLRAFLGVTFNEAAPALADQLNVAANDVSLIISVNDDSPAKLAGLQVHDIIIAVDGNKPAGPEQVRAAIAKKKPNDEISLTIVRKQKEMTISAKLASAPVASLSFGASQEGEYAAEPLLLAARAQLAMETDAQKAAIERAKAKIDLVAPQHPSHEEALRELAIAKKRLDETRAKTMEGGEFVIVPNSNDNDHWRERTRTAEKGETSLVNLEERLKKIEKLLAELAEVRAAESAKK